MTAARSPTRPILRMITSCIACGPPGGLLLSFVGCHRHDADHTARGAGKASWRQPVRGLLLAAFFSVSSVATATTRITPRAALGKQAGASLSGGGGPEGPT